MDKGSLNITRFKAVIFDLGNVILSFDNRKTTRFIAARSGFPEDEVHGFVFGTELEKAIDRGKISLGEFLDRINERFASKISLEEFTPVWCDMFTQNEGVEDILRGLKRQNYRLGLLSNTNRTHFEFVRARFTLLGLIDDYHLSYENGYIKPEVKAFENLISFYGGEARSLVFTDDLENNVKTARLLGINAFLFRSAPQLLTEFEGLGLSTAL